MGFAARAATLTALCLALCSAARADVGFLGSEFQVDVFTPGSQERPNLACDDTDGSFVATWEGPPTHTQTPTVTDTPTTTPTRTPTDTPTDTPTPTPAGPIIEDGSDPGSN